METKLFDFFPEYTGGISEEPTYLIVFSVISLMLSLAVILDFLRFRFEKVNVFFKSTLRQIIKEHEIERYNGSIPYALGFIFLFLFMSNPMISLSCIIMVIADPAAAIMGSKWGKLRFSNGKSLVGSVAFFLTGFLGCCIYLGARTIYAGRGDPFSLIDLDGSLRFSVIFCILGGNIFAAMIELFAAKKTSILLDDNLLVPVGAALGLAFFGNLSGLCPLECFFDLKFSWLIGIL